MISVSSQNSVKAYCNTNRGSLVAILYQDFHAIIEEKIIIWNNTGYIK